MHRVGIDGRCLFSGQRTGVTRVLWNLLDHLFREEHGIDFLLYLSDHQASARLPEVWRGVRKRVLPSRFLSQKRLWENLVLPPALRGDSIDVFVSPNYVLPLGISTASILFIYDISYAVHPEWFPSLRSSYVRFLSGRGAKRATRIVTISDFCREEIRRHYGVPAEKIERIYCASDPRFFEKVPEEEIRRVRRKYAIDGEYILYVGSLHPRRQIPELLAAVAGSGREGALNRTLVLVGHNNYCPRISISELIRKGGAQSAATYLDFVPEEDLLPLYAGCDIVAYISRYEGFGLPVVEGMACGKPVVTSNNGALREVAGDGAVLVDPTNVAEIRGAFQRLINDRTYYEEIRRKGFQRCQEFSWAKSADGFLAIIREVLREES